MQGARRGPWWLPRASRATPQTPLSLPTLRDRADFPSCGVVASLLGIYPTSPAPPCLRGNLPRSRPRGILRQAPSLSSLFSGFVIRGFNRVARTRCAFIDVHDFVLAHLNDVTVVEVVAPDAFGLHVNTVGTVQVLDEACVGLRHDLTVVPADELAVD